jgi:hypothetical protein
MERVQGKGIKYRHDCESSFPKFIFLVHIYFLLTLQLKVLLISKMDKQQEQLDTLREIRSLMDRSSRFQSLSGLSGVIAGLAAIAGIAAACLCLGISPFEPGYYRDATLPNGGANPAFYLFMAADLLTVLFVSLLAAGLLAVRKARQSGHSAWDATAKRLVVNLAIPLAAGGLYCLALLYHGQVALIAPATLIFYGLSLLNASKYTLNDIRYLGITVIIAGLAASAVTEYGLLFWTFGFGVLHIVYGIIIHLKYGK